MSNFLIYRSSAGSGKTYTLVKEYLKIVLNNPSEFRHTLAVTFTNKAADEMKS
jgi:ATP-dependent exoDNAse (exonuclease V) beta subunit